jgi:hypothetical protein
MTIILLVLLFLVSIAVFWFLWKASEIWRWYHIVIALGLYFLTIAYIPLTAGVLDKRTEWSQQATQLETQLARLQREKKDWISGVPNDPQRDPGLLELGARLRGLNAEVGRVFRDMQVQNRGQNGITLVETGPPQAPTPDGLPGQPAQADEPEDEEAADQGPLLPTGSIVYAFAENVLEQGEPALPVYYLGEFEVQQATANSVTITATSPLEPGQIQAVNQSGRWAIYELMPTDSHEAFIAEGSEGDDEQIFGRVNEELVRNLMNNVPEATLNQYLRDGTQALPDDLPGSRWVKIEFTEDYQITVDAMEQRAAIDGSYFDSLGQAVDARLQRGEGDAVSFAAGDQLVVQLEAAEELIMQGVAQRVDEYFVRPLNNYRTMIRATQQQIARLQDEAKLLARQKTVLEGAVSKTNEMLTLGQQRKEQLEKDEAQLGKELVAIRSTVEDLQQQVSSARGRMSQLYRENLRAAAELEQIQQQLVDQAEQRAAQASLSP